MRHGSHSSSLGSASIDVGRRATYDPILSQASLAASQILLRASRVPERDRLALIQHDLHVLASGLDKEVAAEMRRLVLRGSKPDQAAFDAISVAIANRLMNRGIEDLRVAAASNYGWDSIVDSPALGDDVARQAGCIAAASGVAGGGIASAIPGYGTIVGGIMSIGGSIAGQALDCTREQREANAATAAAQAAAAAANLRAAQANANAAKRHRQMLWVGGGLLGTLAIVSVLLLK